MRPVLFAPVLLACLAVPAAGPRSAAPPRPAAAAKAAAPATPSRRGLTDTSASPHVVVRSVGLADVKWMTGFWADRFQTCRADMIPAMGQVMEGTKHSHFLEN